MINTITWIESIGTKNNTAERLIARRKHTNQSVRDEATEQTHL